MIQDKVDIYALQKNGLVDAVRLRLNLVSLFLLLLLLLLLGLFFN